MSDDPKPLFSIPPVKGAPAPTPARDDEPMFSIPPAGAARQVSGEASPKSRGILDNAPDDTSTTGTLKNFGSSLIDAATGIVGQVGDMRSLADYAVQRAKSFTSGKPLEQVQRERQKFERQKEQAGKDAGLPNIPKPPTSEEVRAAVVPASVGNYEPQTSEGKLGRAVASVVPSLVAPGKLAGAAPTLATAKEAVKTSVKAAPLVGVGAAAGHEAAEATDDPLVGVVTGILAPMAAAKVGSQTGRLNPLKNTEAEAGRRLRELATDPDAVERTARGNTERQSLGQATGDIGILINEERGQSLHDKFREGYQTLLDEQNANRAAIIRNLETGGSPENVARSFNDHMEMLQAFHDASVQQAEARQAAMQGVVPTARANELGDTLRDNLRRFKTEMNGVRNDLYGLVDPDGRLTVPSGSIVEGAGGILAGRSPQAEAPTARTQEAFDAALSLNPHEASYRDLRALDGNINGALAKANLDKNGASDASMLTALKGRVRSALDNAVENYARLNAEEVTAGRIAPEASFEQQVRDAVAQWQQRQQAAMGDTAGRATGTTGTVEAGDTSLPPGTRASNAGPAAGEGATPIQDTVPFDADAAGRLAQANRLNAQYQQDYKNGPVAKILQSETGYANDFKATGSQVGDIALLSGDNGYENARRIMGAGGFGPEVTEDMARLATQELRNAMDKNGGVLTQRVLDKWRNDYGGALRAIEEEVPNFSQTFNDVAAASTAADQIAARRTNQIREFENSAAKRYLNAKSADDVIASTGRMLQDSNSTQQVNELLQLTANMPAVQQGIRRAGVEWMMRKLSNAGVQGAPQQPGGREHTMSLDKIRRFIEEKSDTIHALYGQEGYDNMVGLLDDVMRKQEAISKTKMANSKTAAMGAKYMGDAAAAGAKDASLSGAGLFNTLQLFWGGNFASAAGSAVGMLGLNALTKAMKERNVVRPNDLMMEAFLNPQLAAELMKLAREGGPKYTLNRGRQLINALDQVESGGRDVEERRQRADGGRVDVLDHASEAARYVRNADRVRAANSRQTAQFLNTPDTVVAQALAKAHEAL